MLKHLTFGLRNISLSTRIHKRNHSKLDRLVLSGLFFCQEAPKHNRQLVLLFPLPPNSVLVRVVKLDVEDKSSDSFFSLCRNTRLLIIKKTARSTQLLKAGAGKISLPLSPCSAVLDRVKNSKNSFWIMPCRQNLQGEFLV